MRVGIIGCSGRMGTLLGTSLKSIARFTLGPGFSRTSAHTLSSVIDSNDVLVDFSSSSFSEELLLALLCNPKPLIFATTKPAVSLSIDKKIEDLAVYVPVIVCSNTSLGAYVQKRLAVILASVFDDTYDIRITEVHHRKKKDLISGTANELVSVLCDAKEKEWQQNYSVGSNCDNVKNIELHASRVGNISGEHEIAFISDKEQITLRHTVFSREVFAEGVVRILDWLLNESPPPGCYGPEVGLKVSV
ncbi:Dihydrodipicolinate reductase,dihydrodipicolinate reductase,Dihydrodipicolinate reductase,dihydrodipicolinate reductase,Dihydrodipicolinate reductase, C-terminus [Chlamydia poikilotherma]|uniref:4-hydroxy-tetrahydrodipicolinate reductase n=1 Tax=Chlamydia poikilotherma TaxID=1967783 RepID=A0A3B0PT68_9CHLA|nr:dihydrodipicolinate reductase C-terminal domain-containing protein [Chlamydia poikilotherma]SYX09181.1 Dihydrodipicolinate reductase,dihydrodipicolinate reductase,Dihydrodipicolinate reductase,dihydrodipicolinate reductase,Dihydrodipicolinate reductase, C-terminus [Chlamydia poikilotherma]